MEKLLLSAFFPGKKLDVIDQQGFGTAVVLLKCFNAVTAQGLDHLRDKTFRLKVQHLGPGVLLVNQVAGGMQQMCFTQAGAAIQHQGVICAARFFCDLLGGGVSQFV